MLNLQLKEKHATRKKYIYKAMVYKQRNKIDD